MPDIPANASAAQARDLGADILADLQRMVEEGTTAAPAEQPAVQGTSGSPDIAARKELARTAIGNMRAIIERYEAEDAAARQQATGQAEQQAAVDAMVAEQQRAAQAQEGVADIKAKYGF